MADHESAADADSTANADTTSADTANADEFVITVNADVHGAVLELDAQRWSHDAMTEAIRHQLTQVERPVSVWIDNPDRSVIDAAVSDDKVLPSVADRLDKRLSQIGLKFQRDLYRMECPLPLAERTEIVTRPFATGGDDEAWVAVNNRAFRGHREQGGWTLEMLQERQGEEWFSADGFRIHEIDGALAAFCWTKIHADETPAVGEVYVIAVDPTFHGRGLGRALTLAGYQHLQSVGITQAMLYVDADNTPALTLYKDLGLEIAVVRRLFTD